MSRLLSAASHSLCVFSSGVDFLRSGQAELREMMYAECRADCEAARARFEVEYQAKYPKAVESLTANWERTPDRERCGMFQGL